MANEFKGIEAHSAEYFGDQRDFWWNQDFLSMCSSAWNTDGIKRVLDVGCGVGHWGRVISKVLPEDATILGVDREPIWVSAAERNVSETDGAERFQFKVGVAEQLPCAAGEFDLATCQTLLMHVRDPTIVLREMLRVVRPGGIVLVAEPTNVWPALSDALALGDSPRLAAKLIEFQLTCQKGKSSLGEGNDLLGEQLPAYLAQSGLEGISIRLNDRPSPMVPPYDRPEQQAIVDEFQDSAVRGIWIWNREDTRRYFLAGDGDPADFEDYWDTAIDQQRRGLDAIRESRYVSGGGGLFYLAWGRKPDA